MKIHHTADNVFLVKKKSNGVCMSKVIDVRELCVNSSLTDAIFSLPNH